MARKIITLDERAIRKIIAYKYRIKDTDIQLRTTWDPNTGNKISAIVQLGTDVHEPGNERPT